MDDKGFLQPDGSVIKDYVKGSLNAIGRIFHKTTRYNLRRPIVVCEWIITPYNLGVGMADWRTLEHHRISVSTTRKDAIAAFFAKIEADR